MANSMTILNWYCEKLEKPQELFCYLAGNSTLHWFDRTIEGRQNIFYFIKMKMTNIKHVMKPSTNNRKRNGEKTNNSDGSVSNLLVLAGTSNNSFVTPEKNVSSVIISTNSHKATELDTGDIPNGAIKPIRSSPLKYIQLRGVLQIRKEECRTIYERPCKLTISYAGDLYNDFCIKEITYQDCVSCRKSLLAEFENCFDDEGFVSETN